MPLRLRRVDREQIYSRGEREADKERIRQFFEVNPKRLKFADGLNLINMFIYDPKSIYQETKLKKENTKVKEAIRQSRQSLIIPSMVWKPPLLERKRNIVGEEDGVVKEKSYSQPKMYNFLMNEGMKEERERN